MFCILLITLLHSIAVSPPSAFLYPSHLSDRSVGFFFGLMFTSFCHCFYLCNGHVCSWGIFFVFVATSANASGSVIAFLSSSRGLKASNASTTVARNFNASRSWLMSFDGGEFKLRAGSEDEVPMRTRMIGLEVGLGISDQTVGTVEFDRRWRRDLFKMSHVGKEKELFI